jgi:hypothetical protein
MWMAAIIAYIIHILLKNPNSPGTTQRGDGCRYVIMLMRRRMGAAVRRIRPLWVRTSKHPDRFAG